MAFRKRDFVDDDRAGEIEDRIAALEAKVAALEQALDELTEGAWRSASEGGGAET